jgi:hypothetical protein
MGSFFVRILAAAKKAYLRTLAYPPSVLTTPEGDVATIKPYDGPDAQTVIQNVNSRGQHNPNNPSRSHNHRSNSISVFPNQRPASNSISSTAGAAYRPMNGAQNVTIPEFQPIGREPSPTLPNLPTHPTLNSLINSSLGEAVANPAPPSDPAILATSLKADVAAASGGPRIGDPGKRMVGAALGVRHPALGPRTLNGNGNAVTDQAMRDVQTAMGGLLVQE